MFIPDLLYHLFISFCFLSFVGFGFQPFVLFQNENPRKVLFLRFLHPVIADFGLRFATLGGKYPRLDFHQLDWRHARHTNTT